MYEFILRASIIYLNYKYKLNISMENGCKKEINIVKYNCILKVADDEVRVFYLKMIGDYYKYIVKTEAREKFKD